MKTAILLPILGIILLVGLLLASMSCATVPAGHVGIVTVFGKVAPETLSEGLHFINPMASVEKISVQMEKDDSKYDAATQDMQNVHVAMAMNFRVLPDHAREIYQKIGTSYIAKIIHPAAQEILKAETAKHKAAEILHKRQQIKKDVQDAVQVWLAKYGIQLEEISISNVGFDPDYAKAIEQKQIQEQKAAQKEYELTQAEREAQIAQARAKGEADAAREAAKGRADALRFEGEAQAEYNKKVSESLTQGLIQSEYVRRWNGILPTYMVGSGTGTLLQLPDATKK